MKNTVAWPSESWLIVKLPNQKMEVLCRTKVKTRIKRNHRPKANLTTTISVQTKINTTKDPNNKRCRHQSWVTRTTSNRIEFRDLLFHRVRLVPSCVLPLPLIKHLLVQLAHRCNPHSSSSSCSNNLFINSLFSLRMGIKTWLSSSSSNWISVRRLRCHLYPCISLHHRDYRLLHLLNDVKSTLRSTAIY